MNKAEVKQVLKLITDCYGNKFKVEDLQGTLNAWHAVLMDYEFEVIQANLFEYVKANKFAPSVADLINVETRKERAVPNPLETQQMLLGWDNRNKETATKEEAENALAEMRKILGVQRGEQ